MDGLIKTGALLMIMIALWGLCYAGPAKAFTFGHLATERRTFCSLTQQPVRRHLTAALSSLHADIDSSMNAWDRQLAFQIDDTTSFSGDKSMSSLVRSLDASVSNLRCMGRALDLVCRRTLFNRRDCLFHHNGRHFLYRQHTLPGNLQSLRSGPSFQQSYREILHEMEQLRAAAGRSGSTGAGDEACQIWQNNSAVVLSLTYRTVTGAQSLLNEVNTHCRELGI